MKVKITGMSQGIVDGHVIMTGVPLGEFEKYDEFYIPMRASEAWRFHVGDEIYVTLGFTKP